jgi:hypothetical protein
MTRGPSTASARACFAISRGFVSSAAGSATFVPLNERPRDEPTRAGDEAAEETDERAEGAQEHDPDAPGLGIFRDDELEDIPEPNEPS